MGLPMFRAAVTFVAAIATTTALMAAGPAFARPCLDCEDPELPGPGGPSCPTITASTEPSILTAGPYKVGQALVGHRGTWSNAASYEVRWFADGVPVTPVTTATATTVQYVPTAADRGTLLRLRVTAFGSDRACAASEYSAQTTAVGAGVAPAPTVAPSVAGERKVGMLMQASAGGWSPSASGYQFTWWRGAAQVASGSSYTAVAADHGSTLRLVVMAARAGHDTGTTTVTVGTIGEGTAPSVVTEPSVGGTPRYGSVLHAVPGSWSMSPEAVDYQWLRSGIAIPGATGPTYRLVLADIGKSLSLSVLVTSPGHAQGSAVAEAGTVKRAVAPQWRAAKPRLKGKDRLSKKARVVLTKEDIRRAAQAPGAMVRFQWLRNGKPIAGQTKRAHRLVKRDKGKRISVRITLTQAGHDPLVLRSRTVKVRNKGTALR